MIIEKLKDIVAEQFGVNPEEVSIDTNFVDEYDADSIDIVEMMMAIEQEFGIGEIEEAALEGFKTVGDVANYIKDHM